MNPQRARGFLLSLAALLTACGGESPAQGASATPARPLSVEDTLELLEEVRGNEGLDARGSPASVSAAPTPSAVVVFAARLIDDQFRPLSAGSLVLTRPDDLGRGSEEVARAHCDANGSVWLSVAVSDLPGEKAELVAMAPNCAHATVNANPPREPTGGLVGLGEIRLAPGCEIRGRVVDAAGLPVAQARVVLTSPPSPSSSKEIAEFLRLNPILWPQSPLAHQVTDASGEFVLEGARAGEWAVVVALSPSASEAFVPAAQNVRAAAGETLRVEDLRLVTAEPGETLRGRVLDPEGVPVPYAQLELFPGDSARSFRVLETARQDGSFYLLAPLHRSWLIEARDPQGRFAPVRCAPILGGSEVVLEFSVPTR